MTLNKHLLPYIPLPIRTELDKMMPKAEHLPGDLGQMLPWPRPSEPGLGKLVRGASPTESEPWCFIPSAPSPAPAAGRLEGTLSQQL